MAKSPQKLIVILGPTSSGKSDLAVEIAKKIKGEVISADSRQVYKGMDIGTGKVTKKEKRGIKHHLLDVIKPTNLNFNVSKFQSKANGLIRNIAKRGRVPMLVGGTGFWIDAVARSISLPDIPPNKELRRLLQDKSAEQLFSLLKKTNPERARDIKQKNEVNNRHRLIRAIEIAKSKIPTQTKSLPQYDVLFIGLDLPSQKLYKKIDARLKQRMAKGMLKEVKRLHKNGASWKRLEGFGLEYKFAAQYLQGTISKKEMMEKLSYAIKHFAKRQRTWFKRHKDIHWFNPENKKDAKQISRLVNKFLNN